MAKTIVYAAALLAALITVVGSRFVVPVAILIFKAIEESFAPVEPELAVAALPVAVVADAPVEEPAKPAPRRARRRKPSKALLEKVEAIA